MEGKKIFPATDVPTQEQAVCNLIDGPYCQYGHFATTFYDFYTSSFVLILMFWYQFPVGYQAMKLCYQGQTAIVSWLNSICYGGSFLFVTHL